jgi:hypothetical protein
MQEEKNIIKKFKLNGFIKAAYIMVIILGGMVTYNISNNSQNMIVNNGTKNVVDNFSINRVQNIAKCMTDKLLTRLANDLEYRVESDAPEDLFGGKVTYIVKDTSFEKDSRIKIIVIAKYNTATKIITTYIAKKTNDLVPTFGTGQDC